uniref:Uncharacterized protein n=1 Tax=Glossina brevipalpis TaxID=37001 RepID=A0A1A9W134_9MUSC
MKNFMERKTKANQPVEHISAENTISKFLTRFKCVAVLRVVGVDGDYFLFFVLNLTLNLNNNN